jgi:hypothetical protein
MYPIHTQVDLSVFETVRRPIQCEGIERGPKRMADVAASGAVIPQQLHWYDVLKGYVPGL